MKEPINYNIENALNHPSSLIIGIGNSARSDDGLGWAFTDIIKESGNFLGDIIQRYQLQVEDADFIKDYKTVIFVDALKSESKETFKWERCKPSESFGFSTHALEPEAVLSLCHSLYNAYPKAYNLGIKGIKWELQEGMTTEAHQGLREAISFFEDMIMVAIVS